VVKRPFIFIAETHPALSKTAELFEDDDYEWYRQQKFASRPKRCFIMILVKNPQQKYFSF